MVCYPIDPTKTTSVILETPLVIVRSSRTVTRLATDMVKKAEDLVKLNKRCKPCEGLGMRLDPEKEKLGDHHWWTCTVCKGTGIESSEVK